MNVRDLAVGAGSLLLIAAVMALLLLLRVGGRPSTAWAALRQPGAWRWPLRAALLGCAACVVVAALALPRVFATGCEEALGAEWLARGAILLAAGFAAAAVLCLAARGGVPVEATAPGRPHWVIETGRGLGVAGLVCLAVLPACASAALWPLLGREAGPLAFRTAANDRAGLLCPRPEAVAAVPLTPAAPVAAPAGPSNEERLLAEMRDLLRDMARERRTAQAALPAPPIPPRVEPPRLDQRAEAPRAALRRPGPVQPRGDLYYGYPTDY